MTIFEFVTVAVSIVLGVSLAQMLTGIAEFAHKSKRVRFYGPHTVWLINLVLLHFLMWWSFWGYRDADWNYARFLTLATEPLLILLVSSLLVMADKDQDVIDLKRHFGEIRIWFFSSFLVLEAMFILDGPAVFLNEPLWVGYRVPQLLTLAAFLVGLLSRRDAWQLVAAWSVLGIMLWSSVMRFLPAAA